MIELVAAALVLLASHFGLSSTPLRATLIAACRQNAIPVPEI